MAIPITNPTSKVETWKRLVAEWQRSGLSITAFCKARGLKDTQFYYWRPLVDPRPAAAATAKTTALTVPAKSFVPVRVAQPRAMVPELAAVEFTLPGGMVIRLEGEVSDRRIMELTKELLAYAC